MDGINSLSDVELRQWLDGHHRNALAALRSRWEGQRTAIESLRKAGADMDPVKVQDEAVAAQMRSVGKRVMEMPMMAALMPQIAKLNEQTDAVMWRDLAALYAHEAKLDDSSIILMRSKHSTAQEAGRRALTKRQVEDPILKVVRTFERSIAEDTVRNEYQLRPQLRQWIAAQTSHDLAAFNARVYAELFLTPGNDPWLGLGSEDAYTALPERGIVTR